jgi:hypothetical protein
MVVLWPAERPTTTLNWPVLLWRASASGSSPNNKLLKIAGQ